MDPSFLRRQVLSQQAMALSSTLPSGHSYYTVESLEGASSLPSLKPAAPAPLPGRESLPPALSLPFERDLRLDAQTRALLADREVLAARARLLTAEREALLRSVPGGALQDQRMYAGGLQALDARARLTLDGLQNADVRARVLLDNGRALLHGLDARPGVPSVSDNRVLAHGLDMRPRDPLQPGALNVPRGMPAVGGIAAGTMEHGALSELLRSRELGVGGSFLPAADPILAQRGIANWRVELPNVAAQNAHLLANGVREPVTGRSGPAEANKVISHNRGVSNSQAPSAKLPAAKIKLPPEQSEGWCFVCKIDCHNIKTLGIHVNGRKHKAATAQLEGNATPSTSQPDKKRANDEPEALQSTKRLKASTPVATSNTPMVTTMDVKKANITSQKAKPTATSVVSNPSQQVCELCNITTTGISNLESHLKGKRHAARVKELANPQLVVSAT